MRNVGKRTISVVVLGFLTGLALGCWLYKNNANGIVLGVRRCRIIATGANSRPRSITHEFGTTPLVFIGLLIDTAALETHAKIVHDNWAASIPGKIVFFAVNTTATSPSSEINLPIVYLEGFTSNLKPQIKYLKMLKYISDHYLTHFRWFMLVDQHFFINTDKLWFLRYLSFSQDFVLTPERGKSGTCGNQCYLYSPGIIISRNFLHKISPYLAHCTQDSSETQHGDLYYCFKQSLTIKWPQCTQEVNSTVDSKYYPVNCNNIDVEIATKMVTSDLTGDVNCMYRLYMWLHSRKLRVNERNYVKLKNKLQILKELIETNDVHMRKRLVKKKDSGKSKQHAEMFNMKRAYSPGRRISRKLRESEREGINWVRKDMMDKLREAHNSRTVKLKLSYGYITINPIKEIQYIMNIYTDTMQRYLITSRQAFGRLKTTVVNTAGASAVVNIVVPLAGKLKTFTQFLKNLERNILSKNEGVSLLVVYFSEKHPSNQHRELVDTYKTKYPGTALNWLNLTGKFARARALQAGVEFYKDKDLLFFADVDLIFNSEFLQRCRYHSVARTRVYFPVMFSLFNPIISGIRPNFSEEFKVFQRHFGDWRLYSFGPVCAYREDVVSVGGFNVRIREWGFEDVQLFEQFLSNRNYEFLRVPDPGLLHTYHAHTQCDIISNRLQQRMCMTSMLDGLSSQDTLVKYLLTKRHLTL